MKRIIVLISSDGYEAIYIDGELYDEGNPLGEGDSQLYFLRLHEKMDWVESGHVFYASMSEDDELEAVGEWYGSLSEYKTNYQDLD